MFGIARRGGEVGGEVKGRPPGRKDNTCKGWEPERAGCRGSAEAAGVNDGVCGETRPGS